MALIAQATTAHQRVRLLVVVAAIACFASCADDSAPAFAGWQSPRQLAAVTLLDRFDGKPRPLLALARDGSAAFCIWQTEAAIVGSWRPPNEWSGRPQTVAIDAVEVGVAASAEGRGVALWLGSAGMVDGTSQEGPLARALGAGSESTTADILDRYPFRQARSFEASANLVMNEAGDAAASWLSGPSLWISKRSPGGPWSPREEVATQETTSTFRTDPVNPRLAIDRSGSLFVVWRKRIFLRDNSNGLSGEVVVRRRNAEGRWDPPRTLGLALALNVEPNVAVDDEGNALVLWGISNGTEGTLWSARFDRASGWGGAERIAIDPNRPVGSTRAGHDSRWARGCRVGALGGQPDPSISL